MVHHLVLPPELGEIYDVFHVSQLKKYILDPIRVIVLSTTSDSRKFNQCEKAHTDSRSQDK